jgi:hypothetical protein
MGVDTIITTTGTVTETPAWVQEQLKKRQNSPPTQHGQCPACGRCQCCEPRPRSSPYQPWGYPQYRTITTSTTER